MTTYTFTIPNWYIIMFIFIELIRMLDTKIVKAFFRGLGVSRKYLLYGYLIGLLISPLYHYVQGFIEGVTK